MHPHSTMFPSHQAITDRSIYVLHRRFKPFPIDNSGFDTKLLDDAKDGATLARENSYPRKLISVDYLSSVVHLHSNTSPHLRDISIAASR